ncbi:MAG: class I tRNA ligase family protein [Patescibacteria group bacterium]
MEDKILKTKSERALSEEVVLGFWQENKIFEKTTHPPAGGGGKGEFVFYEGPPTANAKPALHHLEARAFKDVIPRYKTMQGFFVQRRAGWDTHGLPVELQIEKKLGLTSKKQIEEYGVAKFNKECKDSVFTYIKDWEDFTDRIGYWVDKKSAYYTFDNQYIESLWNIIGKINDRGLLYKDYKVVPWCPRCGTGLSSHELAQGYEDVKDLSVTAKFRVVGEENTYLLAWTTTPWTLPGNVALAVGKGVEYVRVRVAESQYILAKDRLSVLEGEYEILGDSKGSDLLGLEYEPLYPYLKKSLESKGEDTSKAFKIYPADFVTTTDGTGVVHTAVMYGQDDFELGTKVGLPKVHTVDETGHFLQNMDFLSGRFVKDEEVAVDIIKDLAHRGLLFKKEKYEHSYPHCWRCKTPLIYYARDSWYVRMSELRQDLLNANEKINWQPEHIKEGRFGEWLREVKDWAFSRERYWGTPLPVWTDKDGKMEVIDSIEKLKSLSKKSGNHYFAIRHGEAEHNLTETWSPIPGLNDTLTENGKEQIKKVAETLKGKIDIIVTSPFSRGQESAKIIAETIGIQSAQIITEPRIGEWNVGSDFSGKPMEDYFILRNKSEDRYHFKHGDGESYADVFTRTAKFLYEAEEKYQNKRILIVTHGGSARAMELVSRGFAYDTLFTSTREYRNFNNAEIREIPFVSLPHNEEYELDLHKPYIDLVELVKDGEKLTRVKEVVDVWFDSGAMPFAQSHYPFNKDILYPADFISEAIDQTRGWFYTMLAVGVLMEKGSPYKNVICLGHLLDKDGKKMSKSLGNIVEPFEQMDKFGVDAVLWWMYSVNWAGESKNYDEKSVAEINNKVFNLFGNVLSFYELYRDEKLETKIRQLAEESKHVLDQWIMARLHQVISEVTASLDAYDLFMPTRALQDFIADLSTWYLRRSRDRIKDGDTDAKHTLYTVLKTTAQIIAPFAPFFAETIWQKLNPPAGGENYIESVHLSQWPKSEKVDMTIIEEMEKVRSVVTKGLELRQKAGIKIRQPLEALSIEEKDLKDYHDIIKDELNVKKILHGELVLDTELTPELKAEGIARELMRAIQDMRKQKGLKPEDVIELVIGTNAEGKEVVKKFEKDIKKTVGAKSLEIVESDSGEVIIETIPFSIGF